MIPTRTGVIDATRAAFKISYQLGGDALNKSLTINVNTITVVSLSANGSGEIIVNPGDSIAASASTSDTVNIGLSMVVVDGSNTLYNNYQSGDLSFADSYGYDPTANGSITVIAGTV